MSKLNTDSLIEIERLKNQENYSYNEIAKMFDVDRSTIYRFLSGISHKEFWENFKIKKPLNGSIDSSSEIEKYKSKSGKKFVITSAQNNTYVHDSFLKSLLKYCEYNNAELLISTFIYDRNAFKRAEKDADIEFVEYWYDPKILPYRCDENLKLANGLYFCGELNISPTAVNPTSGFHNYLGENSGIIPCAKLELKSLPRQKQNDPRFLYTTGTVTQRNYIQKKVGQKASIHHAFSALIVEINDNGDWFVRQLHAEKENGCFYDLTNYYTPEKVFENNPIEAINYGDIHCAKLNEVVAKTSWKSENSLLDKLKPSFQFVHDVFDAKARNHHNIKDPHFLYQMFVQKTESIKEEIELTASVLEDMKRNFSKVVVVESNHDLALKKYLKEQDYRKDPINAIFFLELQLKEYQAIRDNDKDHSTFKNAIYTVNPNLEDIIFLKTDESFKLHDIECGSHGHNGNNGSRGSVNSFKMQGTKANIGHTHSCEISEGIYCAGVSGNLDMDYNVGGTSWSHSHILTYKNGKRTIITMKNGQWYC